MHDPFTGNPEASRALIESGLVAADVAGLVIADRLGTTPDGLVVRNAGVHGADRVGDYVVDHVAGEGVTQHLLTWIEVIGSALFELHLRNLVEQAVVRRERHRPLLGRARERYPALDLLRASDPLLRLRHLLQHPQELDLESGVLACIIVGIGAQPLLELGPNEGIVEYIATSLPQNLQGVMTQLEEAVVSIGLSRQ